MELHFLRHMALDYTVWTKSRFNNTKHSNIEGYIYFDWCGCQFQATTIHHWHWHDQETWKHMCSLVLKFEVVFASTSTIFRVLTWVVNLELKGLLEWYKLNVCGNRLMLAEWISDSPGENLMFKVEVLSTSRAGDLRLLCTQVLSNIHLFNSLISKSQKALPGCLSVRTQFKCFVSRGQPEGVQIGIENGIHRSD